MILSRQVLLDDYESRTLLVLLDIVHDLVLDLYQLVFGEYLSKRPQNLLFIGHILVASPSWERDWVDVLRIFHHLGFWYAIRNTLCV